MADLSIITSQNVQVKFELATVGKRLLAFSIDLMIKASYAILVSTLVNNSGLGIKFSSWDRWSAIAIWMLFMSPILVYTVLCETVMHGQTFGKKITKIKVIKTEGCEAGFADYFTRWIFMLIDFYVGMGIFGLTSALFSKSTQRLGDVTAGTAVVSLEHKWDISHTIFDEVTKEYIPKYPEVKLLSDNDIRIVKRVLRHYTLNKNMTIIFTVSKKLEAILKIKKKEKKSLDFVNRIVKDYNYYTQQM